jgi:phage-related protein
MAEKEVLLNFSGNAEGLLDAFLQLEEGVAGVLEGVTQLISTLFDLEGASDALDAVSAAAQRMADAAEMAAQSMQDTGAAEQEAADSASFLEEALGRVAEAANTGREHFLDFTMEMLKFQASMEAFQGIQEFVSNMIGMNAQMESLHQQLVSITGSSGEADKLTAWIKKFGQSVPDTTAHLAQATVTLEGMGLDAEQVMPSLANVAAAMSTDLPTAAQAMTDAMNGRWQMMQFHLHVTKEELQQFGLELNSKGQVINNSFIPAFEKLAQVKFGNAVSNQMQTLTGQLTNLTDKVQFFAMQLGQPLFDLAKQALAAFFAFLAPRMDTLNAIAVGIGTVLAGAFKGLWEVISLTSQVLGFVIGKLIDFGQYAAAHRQVLIALGVAVGSLAGAILYLNFGALVDLLEYLGAVTEGLWSVAAGMIAAAWPVLAVAAAIALLVGGLVLAYQHFEPLRQAVAYVGDAFKQLWQFITSNIKPMWEDLQNELRDAFLPIWYQLQAAFENAKPVLIGLGAIVGGTLVAAIGLLIGILRGLFQAIGPLLAAIISFTGGMLQAIIGTFNFIIDFIKGIFNVLKDIFHGNWSKIGDDVKQALGKMGQDVRQIWFGLVRGIEGLLGGLWNAVVGFFQGFGAGVSTFFSGLVEKVPWLKGVLHTLKQDFENVVSFLKGVWATTVTDVGSVLAKVGGVFNTVGGWIHTGFEAALKFLQPLIAPLVDVFNNNLKPALSGLGAIFQNIGSAVKNGFTIVGVIIGWVKQHFDQIKPVLLVVAGIIFGPLLAAIAVIVGPVILLIKAVQALVNWMGGWQVVMHVVGAVLGWIGTQIKGMATLIWDALVATFKEVIQVLGGLWKGFTDVFAGIVHIVGGAIQTVVGLFQYGWAFISGIVSIIADLLTGHFGKIKGDVLKMMQGMWDGLKNIFMGLVTMGKGIFEGLVKSVIDIFSGLVKGVIAWVTTMWERLVGHSIIPDMVTGILQWIGSLPGKVLDFIGRMVLGFIAKVEELAALVLIRIAQFVIMVLLWFSRMETMVLAFVRNMVMRFITFIVGLASSVLNHLSAFVTHAIVWAYHMEVEILAAVKLMVDTFINWVISMAADIINRIATFVETLISHIVDLKNQIINHIIDMVQQFIDHIIDLKNQATNKIQEVVSSITSEIGKLPDQLFNFGKEMIQKLIDGIGSMANGVKNAVSGIASGITSFLHFSKPDEGPLVTVDQWMPDFGQLLVKGILGQKDALRTAMQSLAGVFKEAVPTVNGLPVNQGIGAAPPNTGVLGGSPVVSLLAQMVNQLKGSGNRLGTAPASPGMGAITTNFGGININAGGQDAYTIYQILTQLAGLATENALRGSMNGLAL